VQAAHFSVSFPCSSTQASQRKSLGG
jgi:hypothetical protein